MKTQASGPTPGVPVSGGEEGPELAFKSVPKDADAASPGTHFENHWPKNDLHNYYIMILSDENFSKLHLVRIHLNLFL